MLVDELGAVRNITSSVVLSAIKLVKTGKVLSLAQTYEANMPTVWFHGPFFCTTYRSIQNTLEQFKEFSNNIGSLVCRYEMSDHTGTHVDSLNHASVKYKVYGNVDSRSIQTDTGTTRLGIETMPPVFTRGILLNFPRYLGVDILDESYEITPRDIEDLGHKERIRFRPGDALLFYTGYCKLWITDNSRYLSNNPGPGLQSAVWLVKNRIGITGSDTPSYEVVKPNSKELFPCHQLLIKENGVHLIENMKLDALAREEITEFLFACAPLKLKGGAGSPVAPVAVY